MTRIGQISVSLAAWLESESRCVVASVATSVLSSVHSTRVHGPWSRDHGPWTRVVSTELYADFIVDCPQYSRVRDKLEAHLCP